MRMQVKLEIGHKAACRQELTAEGYTHDWTVFVRGSEGKDISHFVEKVIFHLHESFPRPKRAVKEPPFKLDECGYGSFELKIEVCFKTKDEPRRVTFTYDLFLPLSGYPPVTNVRTEALTFTHPTDDFMKKLMKGGGFQISSSNGVSNGVPNGHGSQSKDESKETTQTKAGVPEGDKSKKSKFPKPSSKTAPVVGMKRSPQPHEHTTTDGSSKKKRRPSESSGSSSKSKLAGSVQSEATPSTSLPLTTEVKDLKIKFKPIPPKKEHEPVNHHREKVKSHSSRGKDLKNHTEHAPVSESKTKSDSAEHKSKIKKKGEKQEKKHTEKKEKKEKKDREKEGKDRVREKEKEKLKNEKEKDKEKEKEKEKDKEKEKKEKDKKTVEKVTIRRSSGDSWASSGSSCGLMSNVVSKNKALGKLLSELSEDEEEGENLPTPFKREPSPVQPKTLTKDKSIAVTEKATNSISSVHATKDHKSRGPPSADNSTVNHVQNGTKEVSTSGFEADDTGKGPVDIKSSSPSRGDEKNGLNGLPKKELYDLYDYITNCQDSNHLQKVVDVIETTGLYTVSEKTLEFDLCSLEKTTLRRIQKCLGLR